MRNESHMNYLRRKTADEAELWAADRIEELERELECERMRLVACDVVAMADTPNSAKEVRKMHPDYESAACESVKRRVDECIALRQERDALQADNARLRDYLTRILEYWTQDGNNQELFDMLCHIEETVKAELAATPEQSLARLRNQVREECVGICTRFGERQMHPNECASAIRSMKEPE